MKSPPKDYEASRFNKTAQCFEGNSLDPGMKNLGEFEKRGTAKAAERCKGVL
jgi:hypothetical protein